MSALLPRLRTGVTVSPQGAGAVIKDPVRREFFRLGALERFLIEHCDGVTPIEDVLRLAERRFDAVLPRASLDRFLASLERARLIEPAAGASEREHERRPRRVRGSLFYLRVPLVDPDALLGRLAQRLGFLYSPVSVVLGGALILVALGIAVVDWPDIVRDAGRLYRLSAVPEIWLTVWSVVLAHELAHGLTCKRFGGAVHELGLLLIYFTPAAYCNVSDAWLFPEKRKRLLVTLAGPWLELCVWALATILWRVTDVESGLNELALIVVATSGIKTLLNLNPFLKLDGYYLLSDLLDMPNLRRRAFRSIGDRLRRVFGGVGVGEGATNMRERRILFGYGVVALVMTLGFLGYAIAKLGRYVTQDRLLPFVLFLGLLSVKLPRKLKRIFSGREDDAEAFDDDEPASAAAPAPPTNGATPAPDAEPGPGAASAPRTRRRTLWLAGGAIAAVLLAFVPVDLKVRGAFRTLPHQNADVRALVDGIVAEVTVHEGEMVKAGDVLARLSATDLDAEAGVLDAQIDQAGARLRLLLAGPRPEDVSVATAALKTVEGHLPYARDRLALNRTLFENGIISRQELQLSEEQAITAQHQLDEARERLRSVSSGARPAEIDEARSELRALEVRRRALEERRTKLVIRSTAAGVVATPQVELHELLHRHVEPGDLIAKVYDDRMLTAEIAVSEQDIADVHVGQRVALRARAQPGVTFRGTVQSVAVAAEPVAGSTAGTPSTATRSTAAPAVAPRRVLVTTSIDNRDLLLRPELTGQAKIVCGRRSVAGLIARRLARTFKVDVWAWS
jgi:multidrug resistance efflux pump